MAEAKMTVLQFVQDIIQMTDSEEVGSIDDSVEATVIVTILEKAYYALVGSELIPEHGGLLKLTAASDSTTPTQFFLPTGNFKLTKVWYATDDDFTYSEVTWCTPEDFLSKTDKRSADFENIKEPVSGTNLRIGNAKNPDWYTSFDDETIIMDSYDDSIDDTLQESKVRAFGYTVPTFKRSNTWEIDLDQGLQSYLFHEVLSTVLALPGFGGAPSQKIELVARRNYSRLNNDRYKFVDPRRIPDYGRS
jgi:hypothetical protein